MLPLYKIHIALFGVSCGLRPQPIVSRVLYAHNCLQTELYPIHNYTNENVWKYVYSPSSITCVSLICSPRNVLCPPNTTSNTLVGLITYDDKEWSHLLLTLSGKCICRITIHCYVYNYMTSSLLPENPNTGF